MRIISGSHRGRVLRPPQGLPVRPTTDLAKESLFNILNNYIDFESIRVLDLFAGTGNISLEFASRHASSVLSIEINSRCVDFISGMANDLKFKNITVIKTNVFTFLSRQAGQYDVIFADPPYDLEGRDKIPGLIFDNDWLADDGWFVMEHDRELSFKDNPQFIDERRYGKVHFSFFRKSQTESPENQD
jgi:16S rRNA (guanine(966)-N(2))-methyltransferase RsmD